MSLKRNCQNFGYEKAKNFGTNAGDYISLV